MSVRMTKGFTLIEMIITVVVLGILGVFTFTFLGNYMNTYDMMRARRSDHQEALYIIERITREFRNANNATVTCANPFTFTLPKGTPADPGTNVSVTYTFSGNKLDRNGILMGDNLDPSDGFNVSPVVGTDCCSISVTKGDVQYQTAVCPKNIPKGLSGFGGNYADNFADNF